MQQCEPLHSYRKGDPGGPQHATQQSVCDSCCMLLAPAILLCRGCMTAITSPSVQGLADFCLKISGRGRAWHAPVSR